MDHLVFERAQKSRGLLLGKRPQLGHKSVGFNPLPRAHALGPRRREKLPVDTRLVVERRRCLLYEARHIGDGLLDGLRHDAVLLVEGFLERTAPRRLVHGLAHGVRHAVGIHDHLAVGVSRGTSHGLYESTTVAQKSLLVCVEYRHKRHLGDVEALAQEVDAHEHVDLAHAQLADDGHAV